MDGIAELAVGGESAEGAFEIGKAKESLGAIVQAARRVTDERGDGGGNTRDGVHAAGDFFDVNSGTGQGGRHDCPFLLDGLGGCGRC